MAARRTKREALQRVAQGLAVVRSQAKGGGPTVPSELSVEGLHDIYDPWAPALGPCVQLVINGWQILLLILVLQTTGRVISGFQLDVQEGKELSRHCGVLSDLDLIGRPFIAIGNSTYIRLQPCFTFQNSGG